MPIGLQGIRPMPKWRNAGMTSSSMVRAVKVRQAPNFDLGSPPQQPSRCTRAVDAGAFGNTAYRTSLARIRLRDYLINS